MGRNIDKYVNAEVSSVIEEVIDVVNLPLQDGYEEFGVDLASFKDATHYMSSITHSLEIKDSSTCMVLSVCNEDPFQKKGCYAFYVWDAINIEQIPDIFAGDKKPVIGYKAIDDIPDVLYEEMSRSSAMAIVYHGEFYLMSQLALPTFSIRCSVSGDKTINKSSLLRNMHMAEGWFDKTNRENVTHFVYRKEEVEYNGKTTSVSKIFAALGARYIPQKQDILNDVIDEIVKEGVLGKMEVRTWHQDHRFTEIYLEFPDAGEDIKKTYDIKHDITPGLYLCTSDVGASSIICRGVYRIGKAKGYAIVSEEKQAHNKKMEAEEFVKIVDRGIFDKIRKLPETLAELFEDVLDYSRIDLSTEDGENKNLLRVCNIIRTITNSCLKVMGKKRVDAFTTALQAEINPQLSYTYYDIAIMLMEAPDRVEGLDSYSMSDLEKGCAKVPYTAKDIMNGKISVKEEDLVLLP